MANGKQTFDNEDRYWTVENGIIDMEYQYWTIKSKHWTVENRY